MLSAGKTHRFVMNWRLGRVLAFTMPARLLGALHPSIRQADALSVTVFYSCRFRGGFCGAAAPRTAPHQSNIPPATATLHAQLFKPEGNGPFPVVIALHGCGGLAAHSEPVQPRYRDWAEQLLKEAMRVLLPD